MTAVITGNLFYKMCLSWEIAVCVCEFVHLYILYVCVHVLVCANFSACSHQHVSLQQA